MQGRWTDWVNEIVNGCKVIRLVESAPLYKSQRTTWMVQCVKCKKRMIVKTSSLRSDRGHFTCPCSDGRKAHDLRGIHGRIEVIKIIGRKGIATIWQCRCLRCDAVFNRAAGDIVKNDKKPRGNNGCKLCVMRENGRRRAVANYNKFLQGVNDES
jgi:hypothetical protein